MNLEQELESKAESLEKDLKKLCKCNMPSINILARGYLDDLRDRKQEGMLNHGFLHETEEYINETLPNAERYGYN